MYVLKGKRGDTWYMRYRLPDGSESRRKIDDGGLRAFAPMSESFIVAPDGSFVGE